MATLVLGTVGRVLGGPLGGLAGTFLGSAIDGGIFGGGATREGPRVANLTVQSAAYGAPLPRLYGRMRVAGSLVWTAGIRESRTRTGGGKRGAATNTFSYSASFAVIVSARRIVRVARIWADGKLLRAADGGLIYPATIRTYLGDEAQPVDPLIAAAEGTGAAPAYRGRAYVVFDDLPLADYGNRIPNLTFEVIAEEGAIGIDAVARDVAGDVFAVAGTGFPTVVGFAASRAGSIRQTLAELAELADLPFRDGDAGLTLGSPVIPARVVPAIDLGTSTAATGFAWRETRAADATVPDVVVVGFSDPSRDFQAGSQRAVRRAPPLRSEQHDVAVALDAAAAKQLAEALLRRAIARRTTGALTLPWRHAGLRPGDVVRVDRETDLWRIRRWTLTGTAVDLEVERMASTPGGNMPVVDAGRAYDAGDTPHGPTVLHVLDLPALTGTVPVAPRLLLAAAGPLAGWRRAEVVVSRDDGGSYASLATINGAATLGVAATALAGGNTDRWDWLGWLDVELLTGEMTLDSASEASVLAGTNLALVGSEIIQFATAERLGPRRFRLHTLLRGRRGTEAAVAGHVAGERFVLLDDCLVSVDLPAEAVGSRLVLKAVGPGEDLVALPRIDLVPACAALRPLSPVALSVRRTGDGGWSVVWIRRSRGGFGWIDGTDAPLAEEGERYRVTVTLDGIVVRVAEVVGPAWTYPAAQWAGDGGTGARLFDIAVAQISATVGAGTATTRRIALT